MRLMWVLCRQEKKQRLEEDQKRQGRFPREVGK